MEWGGYRHQGVSITIDHMGLVFAFFQHKKNILSSISSFLYLSKVESIQLNQRLLNGN